jgi:protein involved in polysaccharide export with SLBB domain
MRILHVLLALGLSSTPLLAQGGLFRRSQPAAPPPAAAASSQGTLATVRPGDTFEVRLGGVPPELAMEFNIGYTVSQDGMVNVPNLGPLRVVGLTPPQVEKLIQDRLIAGKIFTHPSVNINPGPGGGSRSVVIGGGVRQPQRLAWYPDLTASSAVQLAGGLTDFGTLRGLKIIRDGQVTVYDGRKFESNPALDPKLLPGDQLIVRQ